MASNFEHIFGDILNAYQNTSKCKDDIIMDIALHKSEYEQKLDEMWMIYTTKNPAQIVDYNKGLNQIKDAGFKVLRNSAGKHKIIIK